jgi:signal transduction histidine kinase
MAGVPDLVETDRIEALHAATRRLIDSQSRERVARVAVDAATEVLEFPFGVVWAADGETLEAVAISEAMADEVSETDLRFGTESWLWDLYERETSGRMSVPLEAESAIPPHAGVAVPLDGDGLLTVGAPESADPSDRDLKLASILGKNVQAALERAGRERRIEDQRDGLDLLNQIVRHDIRNDLQLVNAYADLLTDHVDGDGEPYLAKIQQAADNAVDLTGTARDLAETMLQTDTDLEPVRLEHPLVGEIENLRSTYDRVEVTVDGSVSDVSVLADDMLASVFRNVLANAVQHNDADTPQVSVSVSTSATPDDGADRVVVRVADNGPGVPDGQKETIFGKGEKGLDSRGTGIGLYLVHTLIQRYGGDVWVTDGETGGAVFGIELVVADGA